jgi:hypothetical protein
MMSLNDRRCCILTPFLLPPPISLLICTLQYQYKGATVTGKLLRKIRSGADTKSAWIVTPSDRRRKDEEISEKALGNIINAQDAMTNRGPKVNKTIKPTNGNNDSSRESSPTSLSNTSDGSLDEPQIPKRRTGRGSPRSDDNSENGGSADDVNNNGKRKINLDDADGNIINGSKRSNKVQKTVTFSDATGNGATTTAATTTKKKVVVTKPSVNKKVTSTRTIGTRSTRGSGAEIELLPELPVKKKVPKVKKVVTDDNVTVVKMLTGTLYLYRGDRPRAEFVRFK